MRWPDLFFKSKNPTPAATNPLGVPTPIPPPTNDEEAELAEAVRALHEREALRETMAQVEKVTPAQPSPVSEAAVPQKINVQIGPRLLTKQGPAQLPNRPVLPEPGDINGGLATNEAEPSLKPDWIADASSASAPSKISFQTGSLDGPPEVDEAYSKTQRIPHVLQIPVGKTPEEAKPPFVQEEPMAPFILARPESAQNPSSAEPADSTPVSASGLKRTRLTDVARVVLAPRRNPVQGNPESATFAVAPNPMVESVIPAVSPVTPPASIDSLRPTRFSLSGSAYIPAKVAGSDPKLAEIPVIPPVEKLSEPILPASPSSETLSLSAVVPPAFTVATNPVSSPLSVSSPSLPQLKTVSVAPTKPSPLKPAELSSVESFSEAPLGEVKATPKTVVPKPLPNGVLVVKPSPTVPIQETAIPKGEVVPPAPVEKKVETPSLALEIPESERREFLLTNGERIVGRILSESSEEIYLHNEALGVLTLPRKQIAQKPVEVILINGDRIVGDIIAENADVLYVRHSSLGILTIPRTQRSTRVVEALLKGGDRIVGEVLTETESFTVIRSATLGTVAVEHRHLEMLNSKVEQIQVKALSSSTSSKKALPEQ